MYYIVCHWSVIRQKVRRARLTTDLLVLEKSLSQADAVTTDNQLRESVDCPDCFDTMTKLYDWDKIRYVCENCGLTMANPVILSTYIRSGLSI